MISKYVSANINHTIYILKKTKLTLILRIILKLKRIILFGLLKGIVFLKRRLTEKLRLSNSDYNNNPNLLNLLSLLNRLNLSKS